MTTPTQPTGSIREIAGLLAWARRLADPRTGTTPGEQAAYLAAKADLLARITDAHEPKETP